jgi:FkbM family methyltransferase
MAAPTTLQKLARPAKVRTAVRKRLFKRRMDMLPLEYDWALVHIGTVYGGWVVPDGVIESDWVCYCAGAGDDITFELGLIERYGCTVVAFDPAPESAEHVRHAAAGVEEFTFFPVGIGPYDGNTEMYVAENPEHMALSAANIQATDRKVDVPVRSLPSVMRQMGHERVDLLKLDLEGWEYEVLPALDLGRMGVRVLAVELIHARPAREALALVDALRACGFVPVHRKHNKTCFIHEGKLPSPAASVQMAAGPRAGRRPRLAQPFRGPRRPGAPTPQLRKAP